MERRRDQQDVISYELFEIIIDRLEKEWFDLMKRVPIKPVNVTLGEDGEPIADGSEDIECAICDDGECENSNAIVFCDGCNLAVHQGEATQRCIARQTTDPYCLLADCYGIPYIPEGQWLCRKCTVSPDRAVSCVLCPHEGGAFKQTTQGKWAHLLCAMWIPETGVSNPVYMEPIDSVERIPKARWKLQCYLCKYRMGACIQCDNKNCFTAFHVTCARRAGLLLKSQRQRMAHSQEDESDDDESGDVMRAWCHKHLPKSLRVQRSRPRDGVDLDGTPNANGHPATPLKKSRQRSTASQPGAMATAPGRKKSARAYKKSYRAGPSLVPVYVMNRVLEHLTRIHVRKKPQLAIQIARFWSLKREARRGAPLLKRLHLEPWTASSNNKEQSEAERTKKLDFQVSLRKDLERMRMLAELVRKREREKLRQVQVIRATLVDGILFPYHANLRGLLQRVSALDRTGLFLHPVSPQKVPDYYDIVKQPMDWTTIAAKIDDYKYTSVVEFRDDIHLVLDNAMLYNKLDTHYHRTAARIQKVAEPVFEEFDRLQGIHGDNLELQLEAEDSILDLLLDYTDDDKTLAVDEPANAVEDITRHFYRVEPPITLRGDDQGGSSKLLQQARRAEEKAARKERAREAALKRGKAREAEPAAGVTEGRNARQSTKRQSSVLKASIASLEARKRKAAEKTNRRTVSDESERDRNNGSEEETDAGISQLEVEQINGLDYFKRFETGWVLPAGSKRRRTLQNGEPNGLQLLAERASSSQAVESQREESSDLSEAEEGNASGSTNRPVGSEGKRKRTQMSSKSLARGSNKKRSRQSERQGLAGEEVQSEAKRRKGGSLRARASSEWEPSTLCWAKLEGHPFYPAEVFDEESDLVPARVLADQKSRASDEVSRLYLVRFYDTLRTFGWIPPSKLKLLFEDEEIDTRMLKAPKTPSLRAKVRSSYERAKAEAEV